jgi:hypothetical protein
MQVSIMQYIKQNYLFKKPQSSAENNKWLRQIYKAGFAFFLIKGLLWIAAAVWVVY